MPTTRITYHDLPQRVSVFDKLRKKLDRHAAAFAEALQYELGGGRLRLDSLWVNMLKPGAAHTGHSMEHMSGWKELDAYHMVMMQVWHPAKEKGDLAPIRAQAGKLADAADTWAKAAVPSACDTPDNRSNIAKVQTESRALVTLAASGSDADLKAALAAVHERFELVNRGCKVSHH